MSLSEASSILWRERELLELLVFKLEEEQLLLAAGRARWLGFATREVEMVLAEIRRSELGRAVEVSAVAAELGLPAGISLRELAERVPDPWGTILREHREALLTLSDEIMELAGTNRHMLGAGHRAARNALLPLTPQEPPARSASGRSAAEKRGLSLLPRRTDMSTFSGRHIGPSRLDASRRAAAPTGRKASGGNTDRLPAHLPPAPRGTYEDDPSGRAYSAAGIRVEVDVTGPEVLGDGTDAQLFDLPSGLSAQLRGHPGDVGATGLQHGVETLDHAVDRLTGVCPVGARLDRVLVTRAGAEDSLVTLANRLSEVQGVDHSSVIMGLQMREVDDEAALGATARLVQPSLLEFLR